MRIQPSMVVRSLRFTTNCFRWGVPERSLLFGRLSLGDDLLCTALLHEGRQRGRPFTMMTARPEIFKGSSDAHRVIPIDNDYVAGLRRLGRRVIQPYYARTDPECAQRDLLPGHHAIVEMCRLAGITGNVSVRPYLTLTRSELRAGLRARPVIVMQSSGLGARIPYPTKEWSHENWESVVTRLRPHGHVIQLGSSNDPALPVDEDLRGRTTLRESAAILAGAAVFVGLEGFITHLARAVDCPSVVVMGGRAPVINFGYAANANLVSHPPCSPCGLRTGCPQELMCMHQVRPAAVVAAALHTLSHPPTRPLPCAVVRIPDASDSEN